MENYITVDRIKKEFDFVNLVITTTNIDAKNEEEASKEKTAEQVNTNPVWDGEIAPSEENNEEGKTE